MRVGSPHRLLERRPAVDLIWNIAEGLGSRNREAWGPVLCEMRGIPYLGSDALTLSLSLDKARTKTIARGMGIATPDWNICGPSTEKTFADLDFPVLAKPRYEGTAKGIEPWSKCNNRRELEIAVTRLVEMYHQDVLVEAFMPGAEFTCAVAGYPLKTLPVLERGLDPSTKIGSHALEGSEAANTNYHLSHSLTPELEAEIADASLAICRAMDVLDFARLDFKLDAQGVSNFLEINPLPTFAIDNTFAILAEIEGVVYEEYLAEILESAVRRVV